MNLHYRGGDLGNRLSDIFISTRYIKQANKCPNPNALFTAEVSSNSAYYCQQSFNVISTLNGISRAIRLR